MRDVIPEDQLWPDCECGAGRADFMMTKVQCSATLVTVDGHQQIRGEVLQEAISDEYYCADCWPTDYPPLSDEKRAEALASRSDPTCFNYRG